jgi:hypothetical protein
MKWPRRPPNGDEAKRAICEAQQQHRAAQAAVPTVEAVAMAARMVSRRSDRFVREVERSLRGSP